MNICRCYVIVYNLRYFAYAICIPKTESFRYTLCVSTFLNQIINRI